MVFFFFKHLATFGGFHFLFGLGAFIAPLCVSLVLLHTDDAVQARSGEALELQNLIGFAGEHSGKPPPSWLVNLPPPKVPSSERETNGQ